MTLYLSRLTMRQDPSAAALRGLVDPKPPGDAADAHHKLVWSAFADGPDRKRDFLWRRDGRGRFITLSHRPPLDSPLFEPPQTALFSPALAPGDRLGFVLRANATAAGPAPPGRDQGRGRRHDVVMHALAKIPSGERAAHRQDLAQERGAEWLARQGDVAGFRAEPDEVIVDDYSVVPLPRRHASRSKQAQFGVLEMSGHLTVADPAALLLALGRGFGRAKAFGCGLMLLRRA